MRVFSDYQMQKLKDLKETAKYKSINLAKELSEQAASRLDDAFSAASEVISDKYEEWLEQKQAAPLERLREEFPVEMVLRKKNPEWIDGAKIVSPSGAIQYDVSAELSWGRRVLKVLNEDKRPIIQIDESRSAYSMSGMSRSTFFNLTVFDETYEKIETKRVPFHWEFVIPDSELRSEEGLNSYKVVDKTGYTVAITDQPIASRETSHLFFRKPERMFISLGLLLLQTIGHRGAFNENYIPYCRRMAERYKPGG